MDVVYILVGIFTQISISDIRHPFSLAAAVQTQAFQTSKHHWSDTKYLDVLDNLVGCNLQPFQYRYS
jgi:hypothetical protein